MYYKAARSSVPKNIWTSAANKQTGHVLQAHQKHQDNPTTNKINKSQAKPTHKQDARFAPKRQILPTSTPNRARRSRKINPDYLSVLPGTASDRQERPGLGMADACVSNLQKNTSQPCLKQRKHWSSSLRKPRTDTVRNNESSDPM